MKTLKQIILDNKDSGEFYETFFIGNRKFLVSIDDGELAIEVYIKPEEKSTEYEVGKDLIINDWDDDDWEEFNNFDWPQKQLNF